MQNMQMGDPDLAGEVASMGVLPPPPSLKYTTFVRRPFTVEAVEITEENFELVARDVGDIREEDGVRFILVDPRLVPNVEKVYIGYFLTRMNRNVRCYSPKAFEGQFTEMTDQVRPWVDYMSGRSVTGG